MLVILVDVIEDRFITSIKTFRSKKGGKYEVFIQMVRLIFYYGSHCSSLLQKEGDIRSDG